MKKPARTNRGAEPRSVEFRREREAEWTELEELVDRALKRGLRALPSDEVPRLMVLYRATLSSLAVARNTALDRHLVLYLESLAARAYLVVYGSQKPTRSALSELFFTRIPAAVRSVKRELGLSVALFALGVAVSWVLCSRSPAWFDAFVGPGMAAGRTPTASTATLRHALYSHGGALTTFASFLFTHNAKIGMSAFALGIAAGVPTALLLFENGLVLGAFLSLYSGRGLLMPLLGWLLPHGVPEILAMLLCGAAGLSIGRALVWPGRNTVGRALREAGRRAALVVAGCVFLFGVAGLIEGVFRQLVTSDAIRFALVAFNVTWVWLWLGVRREEQRA